MHGCAGRPCNARHGSRHIETHPASPAAQADLLQDAERLCLASPRQMQANERLASERAVLPSARVQAGLLQDQSWLFQIIGRSLHPSQRRSRGTSLVQAQSSAGGQSLLSGAVWRRHQGQICMDSPQSVRAAGPANSRRQVLSLMGDTSVPARYRVAEAVIFPWFCPQGRSCRKRPMTAEFQNRSPMGMHSRRTPSSTNPARR